MLDFVLGLIGTLLYPLFSIIFVCIESIQSVFYAFAGIGDMTFSSQTITAGNSGGETDSGIIYYLFQNSLVKNMLMSIMLLALFLIIIFTVMAFIKNAYAAKQKGWKEIVGNSIKGLANFIFIPICCLLGVWLGNILLQAINGATSHGGATSMSRKLFIAAAYNANEFRHVNDEEGEDGLTFAEQTADPDKVDKLQEWAAKQRLLNSDVKYDANKIKDGMTNEYYANIVDEIYSITDVNIWEQFSVGKWYQVWAINYLVLIVGGVFMLYVLCSLAFAMVRRLFILLILFVISPGVCALYPLDEGKAVQSWAGEVKKSILSAYGAVAGMNIFFSLMPLIDQLEIGTGAGNVALNFMGLNNIIQIFILVVGLLCVKEVIGLISGFVGGEDAYSKGSGLIKQTTEKAKQGAKKVGKFVGVTRKVVGNAWGVGKAAEKEIRTKKWEKRYGATKDEEGHYQFSDEGKAKLSEDVKKLNEKSAKRAERKESRREWRKDVADSFKEPAREKFGDEIDAVKKFGRGVKSTATKVKNNDTVKTTAGAAKSILGSIGRSLYEETGLKKLTKEITGEYTAAGDRFDAREKKAADGEFGEGKAQKNVDKVMTGVDYVSTTVLNALGDAFGNAVFKAFAGGKMGDSAKANAATLGIGPTSKIEDINAVDTALRRINHYFERIQNTTGDTQKEYVKRALAYAGDTDSGGNAKLQELLNETFEKMTQLSTGASLSTVKLDEGTIKAMNQATKESADAMAKAYKDNTKDFVAEIAKDKRKG